jgi:hypothetical protein
MVEPSQSSQWFLPSAAKIEIRRFLEPRIHRTITTKTVPRGSNIENGQVCLVACDLRSASLFERFIKPADRTTLLQLGVELLTIDGNVFAVNRGLLMARIDDVIGAALGERDMAGVLPVVSFSGSQHTHPRHPTRPEYDNWVYRLVLLLLRLQHAFALAESSVGVAFSSGNTTLENVFVCPVSLCGWLLEYPVVYDVCGPYSDISESVIDILRSRLQTRTFITHQLLCLPPPADSMWDTLTRIFALNLVPLSSGNCLGGEPLNLVAAHFSCTIQSDAHTRPVPVAFSSTSTQLQTTVISFSLPMKSLRDLDKQCRSGHVAYSVANWKRSFLRRLEARRVLLGITGSGNETGLGFPVRVGSTCEHPGDLCDIQFVDFTTNPFILDAVAL